MRCLRPNNTTSLSLFIITLFTYLLGFQAFLSSAFPLTESLESNEKRSQDGLPAFIDARHITSEITALQERATITSSYDVPGVDACVAQVKAKGNVEKLPSVFYTGYPLQLQAALQWASCFFQEPQAPTQAQYKFAAWRRIADNSWISTVSFNIAEEMLSTDPEFPDNLQKQYSDQFLKELAQAFGEEAQGDVYVVVKDSVAPDNVSWDVNTAWGGKQRTLFRVSENLLLMCGQAGNFPH